MNHMHQYTIYIILVVLPNFVVQYRFIKVNNIIILLFSINFI